MNITRRDLGLLTVAAAATAMTRHAFAATTLGNIRQTGTVSVGTEAALPPFEFVQDGKIVGLGSDILAEVVRALNVKLTQFDLPFSGILPGLLAKKFDFVATTISITEERAHKYAFTRPIASGAPWIMKRTNDPMKSLQELDGKVIGTQIASNTVPVADELNQYLIANGGKGLAETKQYTSFADCYIALANGEIDGVLQALPGLATLVKDKPKVFSLLEEVPAKNFYPHLAWCTRAEDTDLRDFLNTVIGRMTDDGTLYKLHEKWCGFVMKMPSSGYLPPNAI